jgi:type III secretory pathway component EscS
MDELGAFLWLVLIAAAPLIGAAVFASIFLFALVRRRLKWQAATMAILIGFVLAILAILIITGFLMSGSRL